MKLSRTTVYAIQACSMLSDCPLGTVVSCRQLAIESQMPTRFLLQIMRKLVTKGVLISTRGVEGGYVLQRDPADISLLDIMEAIEDPQLVSADQGESTSLPFKRLQQVLDNIDSESRRHLAAVSLTDLRPAKSASVHQPPELDIVDPGLPDADLATFDSLAFCS